jgi:hypothetical protein
LKYDGTANQFIYSWKTDASWSGCRVFQLSLSDGSQHIAKFMFN